MLSIISPSKTLDFKCNPLPRHTLPVLMSKTCVLADHMKTLSQENLAYLMNISPKLTALNYQRYKDFHTPFTPDNARQALSAFKGDVYQNIDVENYTDEQIDFAQDHLRIFSGLYGLLRPLDLIQPYRLEMGIHLSGPWGKKLYDFWGKSITKQLKQDVEASTGDSVLVNLASQEYFKAVHPPVLKMPILNITFKEKKGDAFKVVGVHAKYARGLMVNFILQNRIIKTADLKEFTEFTENEYAFNPDISTPHEWVFSRNSRV